MIIVVELTAPERPAARANGTVNPSDMPITMSRTASPAVKCRSICGVCGITFSFKLTLLSSVLIFQALLVTEVIHDTLPHDSKDRRSSDEPQSRVEIVRLTRTLYQTLSTSRITL